MRIETPCPRCQDLGVWIEPSGSVQPCPEISVGNPHSEPNAAAKAVQKAIELQRFHGSSVSTFDFEIARTLAGFTSEKPCPRDLLIERHFTWTVSPLRKFHQHIENLRATWLLPVGSRKNDPCGYWIITELDDFSEWVERSKSAPIKQLSTIHRVARANFPVFAEQMEIEFSNDIQAPAEVAPA